MQKNLKINRKVLKKVADTLKEVTTNAIENAKAEVDLANALN